MAKEDNNKIVVVKIGSSVIAPLGKLDTKLIAAVVKDIYALEKQGYKVVLVSSGAIACGVNQMCCGKRPSAINLLMALSSLGQILLMDVYREKCKRYKRNCAQLLLTWDDFDHRKRFLNVRETIKELFKMNILPIINENDVVSFEEISFGDNDKLSALVTDLLNANYLIILSDVDGLMDGNSLVKEVGCIDASILGLIRKKQKLFTAGGMETKLEAARIATASGATALIANGREKNVLTRIIKGENLGTRFCPGAEVVQARKRWIAHSKKIKGTIVIDCGAKEALVNRGKSLLSVGIVRYCGDFKKNDSVKIVDEQENVIGCGLVHYSSHELQRLRGEKLDKEVIHRDNLVLLKEKIR